MQLQDELLHVYYSFKILLSSFRKKRPTFNQKTVGAISRRNELTIEASVSEQYKECVVENAVSDAPHKIPLMIEALVLPALQEWISAAESCPTQG